MFTRLVCCSTSCSRDDCRLATTLALLSEPSRLVPDVDARLDRVIVHALEPDPQRRPASAAELAHELLKVSHPRHGGRHGRGSLALRP